MIRKLLLAVCLLVGLIGNTAAVTFANLTSGSATSVTTSTDTASVTITTGRLALLVVVNRQTNFLTPTAPTSTGWTQIATVVYDDDTLNRERLTLFRRMEGSDLTQAHTIAFAAETQAIVRWSIEEATGVDTGGTNGADAVVQSATGSASAATTVSVTLAAFSGASNATFACFGLGGDGASGTPTLTAGSGFTALTDLSNVDATLYTERRVDNDTTADVSSTLTHGWLGGIAIEVKAAAGGGSPAPRRALLGVG